MAASETLSSARPPRSVTRVAAISLTISSRLFGFALGGAGAGHVADGAEAHPRGFPLLAVEELVVGALGQDHAVPTDDLPLVGVVEARDLDFLPLDVLPDVELGPVGLMGKARKCSPGRFWPL